MKDPTGKPAPAGGFKNGGWYSGYQYWEGSFAPKAGMGNNPNQPDIYQKMVSPEVNRQSSVAAGQAPDAYQQYIDKQNNIQTQAQGFAPSGQSRSSGGMSSTGNGSGLGLNGGTQTNTIDLQKVYDTAKNNPDLVASKAEYDKIQQGLIAEEGKINDNPFFSEATRVGRIAKLRETAQKEFDRLQGKISGLERDAETQMDIALKQYDINSQEYTKNLNYLNTLISTGAIAGANDDDLSYLARTTGMSTSMLKSVVNKANEGDPPELVTSVGEDGTLNIIAIDKRTGNVVSTNKVAGVGKVDGGSGGGNGGLTPTQSRAVVATARKALAKVDAATNEDKLLSVKEYQKAVQILMNESGIDFDVADTVLTQQFSALGYKKWKW